MSYPLIEIKEEKVFVYRVFVDGKMYSQHDSELEAENSANVYKAYIRQAEIISKGIKP